MEQQKRKFDIDVQAAAWADELNEFGYLKDEGAILSYIKGKESQLNPKQLSEFLSIAAQSRANRRGQDAIAANWMRIAAQLDEKNSRAAGFLRYSRWEGMENVFEHAVFPPLRETDNRAAKRKTAEQYVQICRLLLERLDSKLEQLESSAIQDDEKSTRLAQILHQVTEETAGLLKAAEEYEQSISGVFHTSIHYEEMKERLIRLNDYKETWKKEFEADRPVSEKEQASPIDELNQLIGLDEVKLRMRRFYSFLQYQKKREELGFETKDSLSLNMVLTGNPGTGKTTIARLLAKIYAQLGVLPRPDVIETDRAQLVGAYVGQTEENVRKAVETAIGGVLFIDEAYSLKREGQSGNDYGQTVIDTLVSLMTGREYGGKFAVILAGYPEEMRQFLQANPGLRSRFPSSNFFHLPDYTDEELLQIGTKAAEDNDYVLTDGARTELQARIEKERVDESFGNARTVRSIIQEAIFQKGASEMPNEELLRYSVLEKKDFLCERDETVHDAREQLNSLIGLDEVKEEVKSLISFVRMQQLRREKGMQTVPIQLHSVFTGNPGTGKTSVAKIFSFLLKECGILKRGHLIVAGRADFVAGYVGQTAMKTKKKIREALGGVLFIDEAYSLLGQSNGDFGKEVIDTLVEEMTKHNENLVVILAGYPNEMEALLASNPGLKSRFKKFFNFPDYTAKELLQIIERYAGKYQYQVSDTARNFLLKELTAVPARGNGRFAANIVDEAVQAQAYRLIEGVTTPDFSETAVWLEETDFKRALEKIRKGDS